MCHHLSLRKCRQETFFHSNSCRWALAANFVIMSHASCQHDKLTRSNAFESPLLELWLNPGCHDGIAVTNQISFGEFGAVLSPNCPRKRNLVSLPCVFYAVLRLNFKEKIISLLACVGGKPFLSLPFLPGRSVSLPFAFLI